MRRRRPKRPSSRRAFLIEHAEALGEPLEDPLLLFSVLYGFWVANFVAFNGDAVRASSRRSSWRSREKQGGDRPAHDRASSRWQFLGGVGRHRRKAGRISIARSRFTILPSIVPLATRFGQDVRVQILCFRSMASGRSAIPRPPERTSSRRSGMRARSATPSPRCRRCTSRR